MLVELIAGRPATRPPAVAKRRFLLSKAEKSFYLVLCQSIPEDHVVFPKVRLADLLDPVGYGRERLRCLNRLTAKHIDFVVCDRRWLEPRLAVELDDRSHDRPDRQRRDEFVSAALHAAGLPLLRVRAQASYNVRDLQEDIRQALFGAPVVARRVVDA